MLLSTLCTGRDNNLNLLRVLAALAVLLSHSFVIATGDPSTEPLRAELQMSLGSVAVHAFFFISGFLVTASLMRSKSTIEFFTARSLRIFPGLLVMLLWTWLGIGTVFSTLRMDEYLAARETYVYLARCATMVFGAAFELPGVFTTNPYPRVVNGSLWTLPVELWAYAALGVLWLLSTKIRHQHSRLFAAACASLPLLCGAYLLAQGKTPEQAPLPWLFMMFFLGASAYHFRARIPLRLGPAVLGLCLLLGAAQLPTLMAFYLAYPVVLAYGLLYVAYVPGGRVRAYNQLGDYSYGIYIYAFPVQQAVVSVAPAHSTATVFFASSAITLVLAIASWHFVEERCLSWKSSITEGLSSMASRWHRGASTHNIKN